MNDDYDSRDEYDDRAPQRRPPPPPRDRRQEPRGPPGPPAERKPTRVSYKSIVGMIVAVVALIFVIILMYSGYSWYLITYEEQPEGVSAEKETTSLEYKQNEFTMELEVRLGNLTPDSLSMKQTFPYDNESVKEDSKDVKEVMEWVGNFYLISIILLIVSIIMMPIGALGKMPHGLPLIPILIALILTLIIPIYFFVYFPPGLETQLEGAFASEDGTGDTGFKYDGDFFGSKSGDFYDNETDLQKEFEMEFAPQMAFWLSFVPMFIILAALSVYSAGKKDLQYGGPPRRPPPRRGPGNDRDREYDDHDYDERPPPRRRPPDDYDRGGPPPRGPPPRPPRGRPPRRGHDAYDGGGHDEHYNPPVLNKDYDFDSTRGREPPRRRNY